MKKEIIERKKRKRIKRIKRVKGVSKNGKDNERHLKKNTKKEEKERERKTTRAVKENVSIGWDNADYDLPLQCLVTGLFTLVKNLRKE